MHKQIVISALLDPKVLVRGFFRERKARPESILKSGVAKHYCYKRARHCSLIQVKRIEIFCKKYDLLLPSLLSPHSNKTATRLNNFILLSFFQGEHRHHA